MTPRRFVPAFLLLSLGGAMLASVPADADLQLGGSVPPLVALAIGSPGSFRQLAGSNVFELRVAVHVTSSVAHTRLSIADGEDFGGPGRGRLRKGSHLVTAPLEVAAGASAPLLLSAPTDPLLQTWNKPLTLAPVTITLSQPLPHSSSGARMLHKVVLVTISSDTP